MRKTASQIADEVLVKISLSPSTVRRASDKILLKAFKKSVFKNPLRPTKNLDKMLDEAITRYPKTLSKGVS